MFNQQEIATTYKTIQEITDRTKRMLLAHDFLAVEKCTAQIEKLYKKGNELVRNAVENIFIFSLSSLFCSCNIAEWRILQHYMPSDLYALYVRQVFKSN